MPRRSMVTAVLMATALTATSCSGGEVANASPNETGTVVVFAAASLAAAFSDMEMGFEAVNPGVDVQLNLAGSSTLREQILEGAPADVFASANAANMAQIVGAGEAESDPQVFARNLLQIAVPAENPGGVSGLEDFSRTELLVGLCAEGVPCGDFARRALRKAGVEPELDTNEPDVRALMTKIAADELDLGMVYVTDVLADDGSVLGIEIDADHNVEAAYPIVRLASSTNPSGADDFTRFVLSDAGRSILTLHGFHVS